MIKKPNLIVLFIALISIGCSSTKSTSKKADVDPYLGHWNIVITETPQGTLENVLIIAKNDDKAYTGSIDADTGTINLTNLKIENNQLTSNFMFEGMEFELKGVFTDKLFQGEVIGMGSSFPTSGKKNE